MPQPNTNNTEQTSEELFERLWRAVDDSSIARQLEKDFKAWRDAAVVEDMKKHYDVNVQGVFIGDRDHLVNLDDLYWSYVMEYIARNSASYDHYTLDYCKDNMKYAGFDKVGIHGILAKADQDAKERICLLTHKVKSDE